MVRRRCGWDDGGVCEGVRYGDVRSFTLLRFEFEFECRGTLFCLDILYSMYWDSRVWYRETLVGYSLSGGIMDGAVDRVTAVLWIVRFSVSLPAIPSFRLTTQSPVNAFFLVFSV